MVALRCACAACCQSWLSAAYKAAATVAAAAGGKCRLHTDAHSSATSMVCQGVRVPPQSKITASTATPPDPRRHAVQIGPDRARPIRAARLAEREWLNGPEDWPTRRRVVA